jgi:hypothetical protein
MARRGGAYLLVAITRAVFGARPSPVRNVNILRGKDLRLQ